MTEDRGPETGKSGPMTDDRIKRAGCLIDVAIVVALILLVAVVALSLMLDAVP